VSLGGCVTNPAACALAGAGTSFANEIFAAFATYIGGSTTWVYSELARALDATSAPSTIVGAATPEMHRLMVVAPLVAVVALLVGVLSALRRGDLAAMVRDVAIGAPLIIVAVGGAAPLATLVLRAVDDLCAIAAPSVQSISIGLAASVVATPSTVPGFGSLVLDLIGVFGAIVLWFELVVRDALLALLLALTPLVAAATLWAPARRIALRLVETFCAAALAKLVVVVTLSIGVTATTSRDGSIVIVGLASILLAVLAPFTVLRLVPLLEFSAIHAASGLRQRVTAGAQRAATMGQGAWMASLPAVDPTPTTPGEDLGLEHWPASPAPRLPDEDVDRGSPPVGKPVVRGGHAVLRHDELGPVIGWHFDE
jgi:hypothetical protein